MINLVKNGVGLCLMRDELASAAQGCSLMFIYPKARTQATRVVGLVLIEALKKAGLNPSREKVIEALNKMPELDLGGFFVKLDPITHNGSRFTELTVIADDGR